MAFRDYLINWIIIGINALFLIVIEQFAFLAKVSQFSDLNIYIVDFMYAYLCISMIFMPAVSVNTDASDSFFSVLFKGYTLRQLLERFYHIEHDEYFVP